MLDQPHEFIGSAVPDGLDTCFHESECFFIIRQPFGNDPIDWRRIRRNRQEMCLQRIAFTRLL